MSEKSQKVKLSTLPKFELRTRISNEVTHRVKYEFGILNRIGETETATIPASAIGKADGYKELADFDAVGSLEEFQKTCSQLKKFKSLRRVLEVEQTGWIGDQLVNRHGLFGSDQKQSLILHNENLEDTELKSERGSSEKFIDAIYPVIEKSDTMIVLYLAALWAVLGARTECTIGHVICLTGEGSTGKTSALCLATSIFQKAIDDHQLLNFGDTEGVLLDRILIMSGALNAFTDFKNETNKSGNAIKKLHRLLFSSTSGKPRRRKGERSVKLCRPIVNVQLAFSMETSVVAAFLEADIPLEDGERARILELKVKPRKQGGIFDNVDPNEAKHLARTLRRVLRRNYGAVGADWVEFLREYEPSELLKEINQHAKKRFRDKGVEDSLVLRVEKYIKNLYATAQLAKEAGLLPVKLKRVRSALSNALAANLKLQASATDRQNEFKNEIIKFLIEGPQLTLVEQGKSPKTSNNLELGFRRADKNGKISIYVRRDKFGKQFEGDQKRAVKYLDELLDRGAGRTAKNKKGEIKRTFPVEQKGINGKPNYMIFYKDKLERT